MTSSQQDQRFIESVISSRLLEQSIDWIKSNMEPEDVFESSQLISWAKDWLPPNVEPAAIFSEELLAEWAESNGWTKA
jgi:hypothetical protein